MSEVADTAASDWIFASGSLIWRPGFDYVERRPATLPGYARRFWQASHDHRGTSALPGRVVTLVADESEACPGIVYRVDSTLRDATLAALDVREQDGYERVAVDVVPGAMATVPVDTSARHTARVRAVTWIARPGNPSWIGRVPEAELAALIASRGGPSGSNAEYLFELAAALRGMGIEDAHVHGLERRVRALRDEVGTARSTR